MKAARKYYDNNLRKYKQRVINQGKEQYRVTNVNKSDYTRACSFMEILLKDPCSYCGGESFDIDHIVPLFKSRSKTDGNTWDNFTSACASCNNRKRNQSLLHFLLEEVTHGTVSPH